MTAGITVLALLLQLSAAQPAAKASIEGTVVRAGTGTPLPGVRVTLTRPPEPRPPAAIQTRPPASIPTATTDAQGKFILQDVDPASYRLAFSGSGYVRQEYGQKSFSGQGTPIDVVAGQAMKGLVIPITPTGNLSGRVLDTGNRPIAAIPVHAMRFTYDANGRRSLQPSGSTQTDDRGEYRLYFLTPGRYFLAAGMLREAAAPRPFNGIVESFAVTYYPGSADVSQATAIEVKPGSELNMDVVMTKQPLFRIRGRVVDSRTGQTPSSVIMSLTPRGPSGGASYEVTREGMSYNAVDGAYEVRDVLPGTYLLTVTWGDSISIPASQMPGLGLAPPSPPQQPRDPEAQRAQQQRTTDAFSVIREGVAYATLSVGNSDVENIVLSLIPGGSVSGRMQIDGQVVVNPAQAPRVQLRPSLDGFPANIPGVFQPRAATMGADGAFSIPNLKAGEYRLFVENIPQGYYVKEARVGPGDALNRPFQFNAMGLDNNSLAIVISPGATSVGGTASNDRLEPMPGAQVVIVPEHLRDRIDLYKTAIANARGQYTFSNVAPGDYKVFGWEALEPNAFFNPDLLKQVDARGKAIRVQESSAQTVDVRVIPADDPF